MKFKKFLNNIENNLNNLVHGRLHDKVSTVSHAQQAINKTFYTTTPAGKGGIYDYMSSEKNPANIKTGPADPQLFTRPKTHQT